MRDLLLGIESMIRLKKLCIRYKAIGRDEGLSRASDKIEEVKKELKGEGEFLIVNRI